MEKKPKVHQLRQTVQTSWRMFCIVWKTDKFLTSAALVATIIPAILPFLNAYIYKLIIDFVIAALTGHRVVFSTLYVLVGISFVTYFIQDAAFHVQDTVNNILWTKVPIVLNQMIFEKISGLDIQYFENSEFKDLLERVRDAYSFQPQQLISNSFFVLQSAIQTLIAFIAIIHLNWILFFLILVVAIPGFLNQAKQSRRAWSIWHWHSPQQKRFWYLANLMQDAQRIKEIKLFQLAKKFLHDIKHIQQLFYEENIGVIKSAFFLNIVIDVLSTGILVGFEIYVILQAIAKKITVGDISFYTSVVTNFQNGVGGLFRNSNQAFENSLYVSSIFEVLDAKPIIVAPKTPADAKFSGPPLIEFRNVTFAYPETKHKVLDNFSLSIPSGKKIAFVGENGAGKSTIVKLLARLYDVDEGGIFANGVNIKDLDPRQWHDQIGILFQDFSQYEYPVKDNIHYGRISTDANQSDIERAAKLAGADGAIESLENKYDQMLGRTFKNGSELSVGQWQKIALSRAFFRNAPILVLDEPTSAIDAKAEAEIFDRVNKLSQGKTVIIISHRFSTVRQADTIYVLDEGHITELGNHEELMKKDGQYATLFKLQARGYQ